MKKSDIKTMPEYFDRYINLVADVEILQAFDDSITKLHSLEKDSWTKLNGIRYAPEKWTANEVLQHLIDWERILSFRALLFARRENSIPQSIDENALAAGSKAERRTIENLIGEMKAVRASTKALFASFDDRILQNTGTSWKSEMSVLAMGFTILGHQIHHFKIIEEKYFPLVRKYKKYE